MNNMLTAYKFRKYPGQLQAHEQCFSETGGLRISAAGMRRYDRYSNSEGGNYYVKQR
ncbi:MAG: hypothetical protein QW292_00920 [Candidatus Parvarchaeota archaeon]